MTLDTIALQHGHSVAMRGPKIEEGPLPAIFYFSLSARASLTQDPYNQPVQHLASLPVRIFSLDLPFHGGNIPPEEALTYWVKALETSSSLIDDFNALVLETLTTLKAYNLLTPGKVGCMGLSRGAFMAAHAAAVFDEIGYLVGFSPLSQISYCKESHLCQLERFNLDLLADKLVGKPLRFYIGNLDRRVSTQAAFDFIVKLATLSYEQKIRSPQVELHLFPSIGYLGHGTPPEIFKSGAQWLARKLYVM